MKHMQIVWFEAIEKKGLCKAYGKNIAGKMIVIDRTNSSIRRLLDDYLWNEWYCINMGLENFPPKKRVDEFNRVCEILTLKTGREIVEILDDYDSQKIMGTNYNREYLLTKFELWTGE